MSKRTGRSSGRRGVQPPEPEDSYPRIPEPKQGHVGHLLAFVSVMAVLGFGIWAAFGTLTGFGERPAATAVPRAAGTTTPTVATTVTPTVAPSPAAAGAAAQSPAPSATAPPGGSRVHVVERGDTLYAIAQRYRTTVEALMAANGITDRGKILHVGDRLILP